MGKNLIFLHGGPGFKDYLEEYFHELCASFNCIFYDQLRGTDVGINDLINQLDDIINALDGKIFVVGHSWGGVLATEYAIRNKQKLNGIVLISTGLSSKHWYDEYYLEQEKLGLTEAPMEDIFFTNDERDIGIELLKFSESTWSEETFSSLNEKFLKQYNLIESFGEINIPILNIYGDKDIRFPMRVTSSFKNFNKNVIDVKVKNAGHFPFLKPFGKKLIHEQILRYFNH